MDEEELDQIVKLEINKHTYGTSSKANDRKRKPANDTHELSEKLKLPKEQRKEQKRRKKEAENIGACTTSTGDLYEQDSRTAKRAEKKRLKALLKATSEDGESNAVMHEEKVQTNGDTSAKDFKAARKVERIFKALQLARDQADDLNSQGKDGLTAVPDMAIPVNTSTFLNGDKTARRAKKKADKIHLKASKKAKVATDSKRDDSSNEDEETSLRARVSGPTSEHLDLRHGAMQKAEKESNIVSGSIPTHGSIKSSEPWILNSLAYQEDPALTALAEEEIDSFFLTNSITVSDPSMSASLRPMMSFSHLPASTKTFTSMLSSFKSPTLIQSAVWPFLFAGRDVIGVAETGSGKTLAFGVPCIDHINSCIDHMNSRIDHINSLPASLTKGGAKAVIVSPTRELALQSYEQLSILGKDANVKTVCVYGGVSKEPQKLALQSADIIVATPGRLLDLMNEGAADLSNVGYLVLDEADRMLDKGFEDDMRKIISATPSSLPTHLSIEGGSADRPRQTLMFTATWPPSIRDLAATFLLNPVHITIGLDNPHGDLRANTRITQIVEVVEPRFKETRLMQIIKRHQSRSSEDDRILVFCLYKKEAQRVESSLRAKGLRVGGIHGDLSQEKRTKSLMEFKRDGGTPLLVATDVAARGLDIPNVKLVINLTFPLTVEDYIHRIGRTGRAGASGLAITLFTEHDKAHSGGLINVLKAAGQPVPDELLKFGTTVKKKGHEAYGAFYKDIGGEQKKASKITFDD